MYLSCDYIYVCTAHVCLMSQKWVSDRPELKMVVRHYVGSRD